MATEVELFEFQDIASRPSIRGYLDTGGVAQISANSVQLPQFTTDANNNNVTGLGGPSSTVNYALGGIAPKTLDSAGIADAAAYCYALGGGNVILPPSTIVLTESLPLYKGVNYVGLGWSLTYDYYLSSGTILQGDGTFPAFYYVGTTTGASTAQTTLGDLSAPPVTSIGYVAVTGGGVQNLGLDNFSYGIKVGAKYNGGPIYGIYRDLFAQNCTQWGFWFENYVGTDFHNINAFRNVNGMAFVSSGNSHIYFGDSSINTVFCYMNTKRGFSLAARGSSQNNDGKVFNLRGNSAAVVSTQACTGFTAQATGTTSTITPNTATGSIAGSTMTITVATSGQYYAGMTVSGSGVTSNTYIVQQLTGSAGGTGTYQVDKVQTVASTTLTIGGTLAIGSGSGFAVDDVLSGTGVVTDPPTYILAGAASTWYVNATTTVGSTTITGSKPTFTVSDLTKFDVGMPVNFTSTANGFTQNKIYFVRSMSATSGSGQLTLALRMGHPGPVGATGTSAISIYTAGWHVAEFAGWDIRSYISGCSLHGPCDVELGGTTRMLIQGCLQGGTYNLGVLAASPSSTSSLTLRVNSGLEIHNNYNATVLDADSQNHLWFGTTASSALGANYGQGFSQNPSTFVGQLFLRGVGASDFEYGSSMVKAKNIALGLNTGRLASGTLDTTYNNVTLNMAGNASYTLPTVASTNLGMEYRLNNPTAFTATINTASSQNIIGGGASGTSISVATLTSALLVASYDGTNYYWARIS